MKTKKILIIGSEDKFSIEKMYERGFKALKYKTDFLHIYDIKKNFIYKFFWKYLRFFYFFLLGRNFSQH